MGKFIDYAALKAAVSIEEVAEWLQLPLKKMGNGQLRGCCPMCEGTNDRAFVITPGKGLYNAFCGCGGGDSISLAAHVLRIGTRDAAQQIASHFKFGNSEPSSPPGGQNSTPVTPQKRQQQGAAPPDDLAAKLAKVRERLQFEHEAIQALGLTPEVARAFDVGYCASGIMRGRICSPMYLNGVHVAYKGLATTAEQSPLMLFPSNLAELVAGSHEEEAAPEPASDIKSFLRVVK